MIDAMRDVCGNHYVMETWFRLETVFVCMMAALCIFIKGMQRQFVTYVRWSCWYAAARRGTEYRAVAWLCEQTLKTLWWDS
jgi:hypothetical protein